MPTSEARKQANQANAAHSTGPKTAAGKEKSRRNSLKHGLTGEGVVLPEADAAEVERRAVKFGGELGAIGEVGETLARRAALNSVRMERGADQQTVALTQRVRQVEADFVPPAGVDDDEAAQLRDEAVRVAMFDPSREATLARQYEAAAERCFYKALKQLRQMELQGEALLKADDAATVEERVGEMMGSFFAAQQTNREMDNEFDALYAQLNMPLPRKPANSPQTPNLGGQVDVPITIGRGR